MTTSNDVRRVLTDENTTLLKSTMKILENMNDQNPALFQDIQQQFLVINQTIQALREDFESVWLNLELQIQMENQFTFFSSSLNWFHNQQRQFLEAITLGVESVSATPIVLPPAQFLDELRYIQTQLVGTEMDLPLPVARENIAAFYQIATTRSRIIDDQLLVAMSLPLISTTQYSLIKITSIPSRTPQGH